MTSNISCPYNVSAICSTRAAIYYLKDVVDSSTIIGRRRIESSVGMTLLEEYLITTIQNSFDIIVVCYFSNKISCCKEAEILSELEANITRMPDEVRLIGGITITFSNEFNSIFDYVNKLSKWAVVSDYAHVQRKAATLSTTSKTTFIMTKTTTIGKIGKSSPDFQKTGKTGKIGKTL